MSSILKALKKLEEEKRRQSSGEIDLSREILHDRSRRKRELGRPMLAALAIIIILLGLITVLLLRRPTAPTPPQAVKEQEVAPLQSVTVGSPQPAGAETPEAAAGQEVVRLQRPAAAGRAALPSPRPKQPELPGDDAVAQPAPLRQTPQTPPKTEEARRQGPGGEGGESPFVVTGIAWNKDSADRLAVVNGQPLTTGSVIGKAIVEEILPDRVRFSQEGRTLEVPLGKSGKNQ